MKSRLIRKLLMSLAALGLMSGVALAQQMKVTIAIDTGVTVIEKRLLVWRPVASADAR